jgi:heat shock protein HslJ
MGKNDAQLALEATENRYSGSAGCNRMTGGFELDGDSLHFKPGAMTMMACPGPLMKQKQAFIAVLQSVTTYKINGRRLELLAGEQIVAQFKADTPQPPG